MRQAMSHAIDIELILHDLMGELFIPAGMIVAPGVNGYAPELAQPVPYDPEKARALLAEAGYPDGFSVTLDCPNDWGDDEIATCRGVVQQLRRDRHRGRHQFSARPTNMRRRFIGIGRATFISTAPDMDPDSERALRGLFHTQGQRNVVGYANPRVDELIEKIETEMVTYARDAYSRKPGESSLDDLVYLPITPWRLGVRDAQEPGIPPDPWDVPRFRLARFKPRRRSIEVTCVSRVRRKGLLRRGW